MIIAQKTQLLIIEISSINDNSNVKFNIGQGYGIIKSYTGTVSFTGPEIYNGTTNDPQNETLHYQPNSNKNDNESNNFNLIGNPLPLT